MALKDCATKPFGHLEGVDLMSFIDDMRARVLDPRATEEDIASVTSLLSGGYVFGADNSDAIARFYGSIIEYVNEFLEPLSESQRSKLPNGVLNRLTTARDEALAYRAKLAATSGAKGVTADCSSGCVKCKCFRRGGCCSACADCD